MTTLESTSVKKLISDLASEGFSFHEDYDEINEYRFGKLFRRRKLGNVVFEKEGVILKIYKDLFFRVTGLSHTFDENLQKPVAVSDDEFYQMQKHIIKYRYDQHLKKMLPLDNETPTTAGIESQTQ